MRGPARIAYWPLLAALAGWGLTVVMVAHALSGPFAGRTCQTGCMQILAAASVLAAALGLAFGHRAPRHPVTLLALLSLLGLLAIYLTVFLIGTLTG